MTVKEALKRNGTALDALVFSGMIKKAEKMLLNNENVEFACNNNVYTIPNDEELKINLFNIKNKKPSIIVLTDKRIFFVNSVLGSGESKQIKIENIQSVDYKTNMGLATIRIKGITDMIIIEATTKKIAEEIVSKINQLQSNETFEKVDNINKVSSADEIRKFKQLLDDGIITQDEFEMKKKELLK